MRTPRLLSGGAFLVAAVVGCGSSTSSSSNGNPKSDAGSRPPDASMPGSGGARADSGTGRTGGTTGTGGAASGGESGSTDSGASSGGAATTVDGGARCSDYSATKNVYWGDLHSHTSYSADAYIFGTRNTPSDAYLFARGAEKKIAEGAGGTTVTKLERPLDFEAVTDHSEWLAFAYGCGTGRDGKPVDPASPYYSSATCDTYRATKGLGRGLETIAQTIGDLCGADAGKASGQAGQCLPVTRSAWQAEQRAADDAYVRCKFTSFKAYEWTAMRNGATLHKNVIFGTAHVPELPADSLDYPDAPALWERLDQVCTQAEGCEAITIPHNSNLSQGLAFEIPGGGDAVIDRMIRYQRLVEIHQHKGNSECLNAAATASDDAKCDFEHVGAAQGGAEMPQSFVRYGLAEGVKAQATSGKNPLELGIVASTDDHDGTPGNVAENTWPGHLGTNDDTAAKRLVATRTFNPGGITGVWAEENTRESLFAAMKRREVYGTSGPRIAVRFYQTWDDRDFCSGGTFPENVLASGGVPMGGTMPNAPSGGTGKPWFVVSALKDRADIAEIDIVKGWYENGALKESVAVVPAPDPAAPCIHWKDDGYSKTASAYYYVRVLEVPTPRWSHFDCQTTPNLPACKAGGTLDVEIQERAWTSPIWSHP